MTEKDRRGYVYLLKVRGYNNLYKIGRTRNPKNRLRTFNVKLPFPVVFDHLMQTDDMYELENRLHQKYAKTRQRKSEFFLLTQDEVNDIKLLGQVVKADAVEIPVMEFSMKQKAKPDSYKVIVLEDFVDNTVTKRKSRRAK